MFDSCEKFQTGNCWSFDEAEGDESSVEDLKSSREKEISEEIKSQLIANWFVMRKVFCFADEISDWNDFFVAETTRNFVEFNEFNDVFDQQRFDVPPQSKAFTAVFHFFH